MMLPHVLQEYPLVVPEHTPERYLPVLHVVLLHPLHSNALVDPEHVPTRYLNNTTSSLIRVGVSPLIPSAHLHVGPAGRACG